jgi:TatA/E family protein of Tat protein translocase
MGFAHAYSPDSFRACLVGVNTAPFGGQPLCRRIRLVPFGLGVWEVVILLAVLALLFGAKGVPHVARRLGTSVREVKDAVAEVDPRRVLEAGDEDRTRTPDRARKPDA